MKSSLEKYRKITRQNKRRKEKKTKERQMIRSTRIKEERE
jgi:hypothetical protein